MEGEHEKVSGSASGSGAHGDAGRGRVRLQGRAGGGGYPAGTRCRRSDDGAVRSSGRGHFCPDCRCGRRRVAGGPSGADVCIRAECRPRGHSGQLSLGDDDGQDRRWDGDGSVDRDSRLCQGSPGTALHGRGNGRPRVRTDSDCRGQLSRIRRRVDGHAGRGEPVGRAPRGRKHEPRIRRGTGLRGPRQRGSERLPSGPLHLRAGGIPHRPAGVLAQRGTPGRRL